LSPNTSRSPWSSRRKSSEEPRCARAGGRVDQEIFQEPEARYSDVLPLAPGIALRLLESGAIDHRPRGEERRGRSDADVDAINDAAKAQWLALQIRNLIGGEHAHGIRD